MTDYDTVAVPRDALCDHIIAMAREFPQTDRTDEGVEWSFAEMDWEIEVIDAETLVARGYMGSSKPEQVASARHHPAGKAHPAEYERHAVEVAAEVVCELTANDGLARCETEVFEV